MFRKPLLAFTGVAALSALAFAPLVNPGTVASADGKARAVAAGQDLTADADAIDLALERTADLGLVDCVAGQAGPFFCNNVDLVDTVPTAAFGGGHGSDSWGWTSDDGQEIAIVTSGNGIGFFRVLDDGVEYLGSLDRSDTSSRLLWNDVKVVNDHAYISSEDSEYGLQVVDMNKVAERDAQMYDGGRAIEQDGFVESSGAHNVVAFEERDVVAMTLAEDDICGDDIVFYDVGTDPRNPERLGCVGGDQDGWLNGGTHDAQCVVYRGPDNEFNGLGADGVAGTADDTDQRDICILLQEEAGTYVVDVTSITRDGNPDGAQLLTRFQYEDVAYAHQGWLTENHRWVIFGDELDESGALGSGANTNTTTYWIDLQDLDVGGENAAAPLPDFNADLVKQYSNPNTFDIDHNMYIVGDLVYQANYGAGLRVLRFSDESLAAEDTSAAFEEVAYFDTYPGPGPSEFYGAWNTYPFFESGKVILSDFQSGLLVLDVHDSVTNPEG